MSIDPARRSFNRCSDRSARWPTASVRTPSWPARLISVEYPVCEKTAPALPAARLITSRSPRRTMTSVRSGESAGALRHRQQMALALHAGDFDQGLLVDDGRAAQQRTGDRYLVLARELPDQAAGRIVEDGEPLGQCRAHGKFAVRDEIDQDAVEQLDMIGPEIRSARQKQIGDPPRRLGAALGIAISDDLVEPGDQRHGNRHQTHSEPPALAGFPAR